MEKGILIVPSGDLQCRRLRLHGSVIFFAELSEDLGGAMMIRPTAALVFSGLLLCAAPLAGCTDNAPPSGQPSFYIDLSQPGTVLDANAAQSMISGYRSNNGLGPLTIDPDLMRLANEQARAMAAGGTLHHDAAPPFQG